MQTTSLAPDAAAVSMLLMGLIDPTQTEPVAGEETSGFQDLVAALTSANDQEVDVEVQVQTRAQMAGRQVERESEERAVEPVFVNEEERGSKAAPSQTFNLLGSAGVVQGDVIFAPRDANIAQRMDAHTNEPKLQSIESERIPPEQSQMRATVVGQSELRPQMMSLPKQDAEPAAAEPVVLDIAPTAIETEAETPVLEPQVSLEPSAASAPPTVPQSKEETAAHLESEDAELPMAVPQDAQSDAKTEAKRRDGIVPPKPDSSKIRVTADDVQGSEPSEIVMPAKAQRTIDSPRLATPEMGRNLDNPEPDRETSYGDQLPKTDRALVMNPTYSDQNPARPVMSQPVQSPERVIASKMIDQIVRSAKVQTFEGGGSVTLRLDPPHLGELNMSVAIEQGSVTASIRTETEAAKQMLQADLSVLKQALTDSGIRVDSISLSVDSGAGYGWSPQSDANRDYQGWGNSRPYHSRSVSGYEGHEDVAILSATRYSLGTGRLDYMA